MKAHPDLSAVRALLVALFLIAFCTVSRAQAPPSIQFFMPDGSLPPRELRFSLVGDDGRTETYHTDTKGRFLLTPSLGLKPNIRYTVTVESDGSSYGRTVHSFREFGVYYIAVFLKPLEAAKAKPAGVIDLAEMDALAPAAAREAYEAAMKSLGAGKADEAVTALHQALAIYPDYFRALNDLGVLYMKLNKLDEAARALERAAKAAPRVYYPRLNLGIVRTRQTKYGQAVEILEKLHKENPGLIEVRAPLADALMATGRLDDAEPHLRAAVADGKLDPKAAGNAHYLLGLLLNRKQKFAEAVSHLEMADRSVPDSTQINLQLGIAMMQVNRLEDAERRLLAAYRLGAAKMGAAQLLLGEVYFQQKKYEEALRAFEQYLADVPDAPNAAQVRGVIEKIKSALKK